MRLFQAPLDTCLDNPLLTTLSVHGLHFSSKNKLPFMILNPQKQTAGEMVSCRNMHFPTEKCIFLQQDALSCKQMRFSGGGGTWQETAEKCKRVSGLKNQERQPTL